jgi:hypothetical protein
MSTADSAIERIDAGGDFYSVGAFFSTQSSQSTTECHRESVFDIYMQQENESSKYLNLFGRFWLAQ